MEFAVLAIVAFLASLLTLFSGFGLGTLLLPVFILFFPVEVAVAITGVVHLLNNLFKIALLGKYVEKSVMVRFGIPAILGAFMGAKLLISLTDIPSLVKYHLLNHEYEILPVKLVVGIMMVGFGAVEFIPYFKNLQFDRNKLIYGGLLSGFFGGLSGHQGALRSAFLIKCGLSKEGFIATGIIIACFVDFTRISVYFKNLLVVGIQDNVPILSIATIAAFSGAYIGRKLLKKITHSTVKKVVLIMIVILGLLLAMGVI